MYSSPLTKGSWSSSWVVSKLKLLRLRGCCLWLLRYPSHISNAKLEQDLAAAIRFQGLLERFLELVERGHVLPCGGGRSIRSAAYQLRANLPARCVRRFVWPIDEPESVEAKTTV